MSKYSHRGATAPRPDHHDVRRSLRFRLMTATATAALLSLGGPLKVSAESADSDPKPREQARPTAPAAAPAWTPSTVPSSSAPAPTIPSSTAPAPTPPGGTAGEQPRVETLPQVSVEA